MKATKAQLIFLKELNYSNTKLLYMMFFFVGYLSFSLIDMSLIKEFLSKFSFFFL